MLIPLSIADATTDINEKTYSAYSKFLTAKEIYKMLEHFDIMYDKMPDFEKKEFSRTFVELMGRNTE